MPTFSDLWSRVLGEIEIEVSRPNFLTLFKKTSLLSLEGNVATIAAPSAMIIDLIKRRFYQPIKKSLDKHTKKDNKLMFVSKTFAVEKFDPKESSRSLFEQEIEKPITVGHLPRVRPDFTFENFAVSSTNQLAFVSATTVAKKIGRFYNPLFIYGPVGVGKTHLMQAIANDVYQKAPSKKIVYETSEEFTNEVVEAIRSNSTSYMKKKFRGLDILLIDDVQFLSGKERVQEELFHTFNILVDQGSQIILSSDRAPDVLQKIEKRLLSRFFGGLTVDIEPADFELRCAIVLIKAKKHNVSLSLDAASEIAKRSKDSRGLEGLLIKVITVAEGLGERITPNLVSSSLGKIEEQPILLPDRVIKNVCDFYKIKDAQLRGDKRDAHLVRARQIAMFMLKRDLGLTYSQIGSLLGGRDHTTIMHGVGKVEALLNNPSVSLEILGISSSLKNGFVD